MAQALGVIMWFGASPRMRSWEEWAGIGTGVLMAFLLVGLLYVLSVALVSPKSANRMFVPRLYIMAAWAISGIVSTTWGFYENSEGPIVGWFVLATVFFAGLLLPILGERERGASGFVARYRGTGSAGRLLSCSTRARAAD